MYPISTLMSTYLDLPGREYDSKVVIDGVTYTKESIISFLIDDSMVPSDYFVIGSVMSSTFTLELKTPVEIPDGAELIPYIRLNGASGFTEWIPMGKFYSDSTVLKNSYPVRIVVIKAYDRLIRTNQPYHSILMYPCSMETVLNEICAMIGVTKDSSLVLDTFTINSAVTGVTIRDVLSYIASFHANNFRINKNGLLAFSLTSHEYVLSNYYNALKTNAEKTYTKMTCDILTTVLSSGTDDADKELLFTNPWFTQSLLDAMVIHFADFSYIPYTLEWRFRPDVEIGDWLSFTLKDGTTITSPILTNKFSFKGGAKTTSTAPASSKQSSEFGYSGAIDKRLKTAESSLLYNAIQIQLKVSSSEFLDLVGRVDDTELKLTDSAILLAVKHASNLADGSTLASQSYVDATANDVTIAKIKVVTDAYGAVIDNVKSSFTFGDSLIIKKSTSTFSVQISNTELGFYDSATKTAWINNGEFFINKGTILSSLTIGVHKIEKYNNGTTIFRYVG